MIFLCVKDVILNVQVGLKLYAHPGRNPGYEVIIGHQRSSKVIDFRTN